VGVAELTAGVFSCLSIRLLNRSAVRPSFQAHGDMRKTKTGVPSSGPDGFCLLQNVKRLLSDVNSFSSFFKKIIVVSSWGQVW
jgi:hypothetical protein